MDSFTFQKDIPIVCLPAEGSAQGIIAAHQVLKEKLPPSEHRHFYGISWSGPDRQMVYKAAASIENTDGSALEDLEHFTIRNGPYISFYLTDFRENPDSIRQAFEMLLKQHEVAPNGYCLEWYINDNDVKCLVPLGKDYQPYTGLNKE